MTGSPIDYIGMGFDFRDFFMDLCKRRRCLTFGKDGLWTVQAVETLLL
jgi:hypothetical protein